jgi:hypothetical protein
MPNPSFDSHISLFCHIKDVCDEVKYVSYLKLINQNIHEYKFACSFKCLESWTWTERVSEEDAEEKFAPKWEEVT